MTKPDLLFSDSEAGTPLETLCRVQHDNIRRAVFRDYASIYRFTFRFVPSRSIVAGCRMSQIVA